MTSSTCACSWRAWNNSRQTLQSDKFLGYNASENESISFGKRLLRFEPHLQDGGSLLKIVDLLQARLADPEHFRGWARRMREQPINENAGGNRTTV